MSARDRQSAPIASRHRERFSSENLPQRVDCCDFSQTMFLSASPLAYASWLRLTHHALLLGETLSQFNLYPLLSLSRIWTNFWLNQKQCLANRSTVIYLWGNPSPRPPWGGWEGKYHGVR